MFGGQKRTLYDRIEASQEGSPYVHVTFSNPNGYKSGAEKPQNSFGVNMMAFNSPEDMKNLPKAMSDISRAMGEPAHRRDPLRLISA